MAIQRMNKMFLWLWSSCMGYLISRASVDGVPSNLVTLYFSHPQYPLSLEILTTADDWVVNTYDDGSHDSTLPVSIIARNMLSFLQREIVIATSAGESERLTYLLEMQQGWATVRGDQLTAEVNARSIIKLPENVTSTNATATSAMGVSTSGNDTSSKMAASSASSTFYDNPDTILAWALGLICLDCLVACIIGLMICTSSKKTSLTSLLAHPARLHYTVTHSSPESLC